LNLNANQGFQNFPLPGPKGRGIILSLITLKKKGPTFSLPLGQNSIKRKEERKRKEKYDRPHYRQEKATPMPGLEIQLFRFLGHSMVSQGKYRECSIGIRG